MINSHVHYLYDTRQKKLRLEAKKSGGEVGKYTSPALQSWTLCHHNKFRSRRNAFRHPRILIKIDQKEIAFLTV